MPDPKQPELPLPAPERKLPTPDEIDKYVEDLPW